MPNPSNSTDLDQATPEDIARVLRNAAQRFYEARGELQSAWQDKQAGRVWSKLAKILERAAASCDAATLNDRIGA